MKVTLDLDALVAGGQLSRDEAARLLKLGKADSGDLGINVLLGFGVTAVSLGVLLFLPSPFTAIVLGALLFAGGFWLSLGSAGSAGLVARVVMSVGALLAGVGVFFQAEGWPPILIALVAVYGVAAVAANSGLLAAIAVLTLVPAIGTVGADLGFEFLGLASPTVTIGVLAAAALALLIASMNTGPRYERVALIAARTALLLINVGFLVGSIFGDDAVGIDARLFSVVWAVGLVGIGIWGAIAGRRWVVNVAAAFGAVHFLIQWFWALGANPLSILGGGLIAIAAGAALYAFNRRSTGLSLAGTGN